MVATVSNGAQPLERLAGELADAGGGRLEDQLDRDQTRCSSDLKPFNCQPWSCPRRRTTVCFYACSIRGFSPIVSSDGLALQRHNHDWLALIGWLKRCCALDDRALRKLRPELERQLQNFSGALLSRPQLLCRLPDPGLLQAALQLRQRGLEQLIRCRQRLEACSESLPQRSGPHRHWLLLASNDLPQCFLYRVDQKRQQLEALGCSVRIIQREQLEHWDWSEALLWADAVIVCRLPATVQVLRAIEACRLAGLPTWYDMDDLVIDPEHGVPPLASYGGTITALHHRWLQLDVPLFAAAMRACDAAIVSTPTLARRWNQLQPDQPVQVLANLAPPPLQKALRAPRRLGLAGRVCWWPVAPRPTSRSGLRSWLLPLSCSCSSAIPACSWICWVTSSCRWFSSPTGNGSAAIPSATTAPT